MSSSLTIKSTPIRCHSSNDGTPGGPRSAATTALRQGLALISSRRLPRTHPTNRSSSTCHRSTSRSCETLSGKRSLTAGDRYASASIPLPTSTPSRTGDTQNTQRATFHALNCEDEERLHITLANLRPVRASPRFQHLPEHGAIPAGNAAYPARTSAGQAAAATMPGTSATTGTY